MDIEIVDFPINSMVDLSNSQTVSFSPFTAEGTEELGVVEHLQDLLVRITRLRCEV